MIHAIYLSADALTARARKRFYKAHPAAGQVSDWLGPVVTFHLVAIPVFFRSDSLSDGVFLISHLRSGIGGQWSAAQDFVQILVRGYLVMEIVDYFVRNYGNHPMPRWGRWSLASCTAVALALVILIMLASGGSHNPFLVCHILIATIGRATRPCAVASVAALLAALEGGLNVFGVHYQASFYTEEKERGFAFRANGGLGNRGDRQLRSHQQPGYERSRARPYAPARNVADCAVGVSEAAAHQVPLERNFPAIIEKDLTCDAHRNIEVLNFGVPGYGLAREYLTLRNHVW